jgi:hypothetical protein
LIQQVHDVLQNYSTNYFDKLDRIASYLDHNHDGVYIDILEYRTILKDTLTSTLNQSYNQTATIIDVAVEPNVVPEQIVSSNTGGFAIQQ